MHWLGRFSFPRLADINISKNLGGVFFYTGLPLIHSVRILTLLWSINNSEGDFGIFVNRFMTTSQARIEQGVCVFLALSLFLKTIVFFLLGRYVLDDH